MTMLEDDMRQIFKHTLDVTGDVESVKLPKHSAVIHVASQNGQVCVWTEHKLRYEWELVRMNFRVVGTGHRTIEPGDRYIGTAHCGDFVWHVYEVT